mmetsp:Transcript_30522/g.84211  ORF Transcript_30522/g.84211 Transcript_30522/m.84211 type:complete len:260 (+) Transcript_30522:905-1684(+)
MVPSLARSTRIISSTLSLSSWNVFAVLAVSSSTRLLMFLSFVLMSSLTSENCSSVFSSSFLTLSVIVLCSSSRATSSASAAAFSPASRSSFSFRSPSSIRMTFSCNSLLTLLMASVRRASAWWSSARNRFSASTSFCLKSANSFWFRSSISSSVRRHRSTSTLTASKRSSSSLCLSSSAWVASRFAVICCCSLSSTSLWRSCSATTSSNCFSVRLPSCSIIRWSSSSPFLRSCSTLKLCFLTTSRSRSVASSASTRASI